MKSNTLKNYKLTLLAAVAVLGMGLTYHITPANAVTWNDPEGKATCEDMDEAVLISGQLIQDGAKSVVCIARPNGTYVVKYKY